MRLGRCKAGNVISIVVGIAGVIVGTIGILYAAWEWQQSLSARWADLASAAKSIAQYIKHNYSLQVFYAPTQKSGILLELM